MGASGHRQLVANGREAVHQYRAANNNQRMELDGETYNTHDFSGWDLSGTNFQKAKLSGTKFTNAKLNGAILVGAVLDGADLQSCDLTHTDLTEASLIGANLSGAKCRNANFQRANLTDAKINGADFEAAVFDSANLARVNFALASRLQRANFCNVAFGNHDFGGTHLAGAHFDGSTLIGASFGGVVLTEATFRDSHLQHANFHGAVLERAIFERAHLNDAHFEQAILRNANLSYAKLSNAHFTNADLLEADVNMADFERTRGLPDAFNVHTTRVERDVNYFDTVIASPFERLVGWEQIRFVGRLPLFAASYSALIVIPFLYYFLDMYNRKLDTIQAWANSEIARNASYAEFALSILGHLHHERVPTLSFLLLISTILLGAGATIFALVCPARIRQYNRDQWRDELRQSLIHYTPFSWRYRYWRIACVLLYAFGAGGVLIVLASKIWNVLIFIWENS